MSAAGRVPRAPLLVCHGLSVHFDQRPALVDVSTSFTGAQITSLVGPNGAGKSTLLRLLAGLLPPTHGRALLGEQPISGPNERVVYVPQRSSVDWSFPVSVLDVAMMALARRETRLRPFGATARDAALAALAQTGMRQLAGVQIGQLSGGQQQRVFLARALLQRGDVYLLDEPFAGVDIPTQELLVSLLARLRDEGRTIVYATHDLAQAARSSDRVLLLNRRVVADGAPNEVLTAANLKAAFGGQAILPADLSVSTAPP